MVLNGFQSCPSIVWYSYSLITASNNLSLGIFAVVRQQFVLGVNCSIFLYRNSFGANQRLALPGSPSQVSLCASSAGLAVGQCFAVMGLTSCMLCVQIYPVLCVLDYYLLNSQLWIQDLVGLCFGNLCVGWVLLRVWLPQTVNLRRSLKFFNPKIAHLVKN